MLPPSTIFALVFNGDPIRVRTEENDTHLNFDWHRSNLFSAFKIERGVNLKRVHRLCTAGIYVLASLHTMRTRTFLVYILIRQRGLREIRSVR